MNLCTRPERTVVKVATLTGTGTVNLNLFQLTGSVQIKKLYAVLTAKTTLTDCDGASFDLFAGAAAVQLTANTGDIGGLAVGTTIAKTGLNAAAFAVVNNVAAAVAEPAAAGEAFSECIVAQMAATATTIRYTFTTTDNPINAVLTVYCEFVPLGGGNLVAV